MPGKWIYHEHYNNQRRWTSKRFVVIEYEIEKDILTRLEYVKMIQYHCHMQQWARTKDLFMEDYKSRTVYMLVHNVDGKKISVDPKISKHGIKYDFVPTYSFEPINYLAQTNDTDEDGKSYHPDLLVVPPQNSRGFRRRARSISLLYWRNKLKDIKIQEAESELQDYQRFMSSDKDRELIPEFCEKRALLEKRLKTLLEEFDALSPVPGKTYDYVLVKVNITVANKNAIAEEKALNKKKEKEQKKEEKKNEKG